MLNLNNGKFQLNLCQDRVGLPKNINDEDTEAMGIQLFSYLVE